MGRNDAENTDQCYSVCYPSPLDDHDWPWGYCLGVPFQRLKDAQIALAYLLAQKITPQHYHHLSYEQQLAIDREVISCLQW